MGCSLFTASIRVAVTASRRFIFSRCFAAATFIRWPFSLAPRSRRVLKRHEFYNTERLALSNLIRFDGVCVRPFCNSRQLVLFAIFITCQIDGTVIVVDMLYFVMQLPAISTKCENWHSNQYDTDNGSARGPQTKRKPPLYLHLSHSVELGQSQGDAAKWYICMILSVLSSLDCVHQGTLKIGSSCACDKIAREQIPTNTCWHIISWWNNTRTTLMNHLPLR